MVNKTPLTEFLNRLEGSRLAFHQSGEPVRCDSCANDIDAGEKIGGFLTNRLIGKEASEDIHMYRLHCENCTPKDLYFSPQDSMDILITYRMTEDRILKEPYLRDASTTADGIPYDPVELFEEITGIEWDRFVNDRGIQSQGGWGSYDIIDYLLLMGIHPQEYIDEETGEIVVSEEESKELQRQIEDMSTEVVDHEVVRDWYEKARKLEDESRRM